MAGAKQFVITGELVGMDAGQPREVPVPKHLVLAMLAAAALVPIGSRRGWKDLRKGPEYEVLWIQVRDRRGRLVELEIHGYLSPNTIQRGDRIRVRVRRQAEADRPPRVYHLANLTTGQIVEPRPPTLWSHLGPDVVLRATLGLVLVLVVGLCLWAVLR